MGRTSDAKERLVAAMSDLVHRRGYSAVSVDEICAAANVKKGSFYYFFRSKRALMLAALDMRWELARGRFMGAAFAKDVPPLARIERLFSAMAGMEAANRKKGGHVLGCPFGNLAAEMSASEPDLGKRVDEVFCGFREFIRESLEEAAFSGQIDPGIDTRQAADAIVAYFEGVSLLAKTRNDPSVVKHLGPLARLAIADATTARKRPAARPSLRRTGKSRLAKPRAD